MEVLELVAAAKAMQSEYVDEQDPTVRGDWAIQNTGSADWALERVGECEGEADSIEAQYAAAVERLSKRKAELLARAARGASYFRMKLEEWAGPNRASLLKGKGKSVAMLHGTIGWRKKGGNLRVEDKDALAAWLITQPVESGLYRVRVEPEMRALQKWCAESGEIPSGCEFVPEFDEFYVKAEAPEAALVKG